MSSKSICLYLHGKNPIGVVKRDVLLYEGRGGVQDMYLKAKSLD
jgi:hypothetical protein